MFKCQRGKETLPAFIVPKWLFRCLGALVFFFFFLVVGCGGFLVSFFWEGVVGRQDMRLVC